MEEVGQENWIQKWVFEENFNHLTEYYNLKSGSRIFLQHSLFQRSTHYNGMPCQLKPISKQQIPNHQDENQAVHIQSWEAGWYQIQFKMDNSTTIFSIISNNHKPLVSDILCTKDSSKVLYMHDLKLTTTLWDKCYYSNWRTEKYKTIK